MKITKSDRCYSYEVLVDCECENSIAQDIQVEHFLINSRTQLNGRIVAAFAHNNTVALFLDRLADPNKGREVAREYTRSAYAHFYNLSPEADIKCTPPKKMSYLGATLIRTHARLELPKGYDLTLEHNLMVRPKWERTVQDWAYARKTGSKKPTKAKQLSRT